MRVRGARNVSRRSSGFLAARISLADAVVIWPSWPLLAVKDTMEGTPETMDVTAIQVGAHLAVCLPG